MDNRDIVVQKEDSILKGRISYDGTISLWQLIFDYVLFVLHAIHLIKPKTKHIDLKLH